MKVPMRQRPVRGGRDLGAAAVEFALVVPLLLLLVCGIMDYGRFFFDSVSLRQGAREAARQAVVQHYSGNVLGTATACTTLNNLSLSPPTVGAGIACSAKAASDITIGTPVVYIPTSAAGWAQGKQLLVCMASKEHGTGFVPLPGGGPIPGDGFIKTKVYMSIEVGTPVDPFYSNSSTDADPTGNNWGWCL